MTGGAGNDWFVWNIGDTASTTRITDFGLNGDKDRIDLSDFLTMDKVTDTSTYLSWNASTHTLTAGFYGLSTTPKINITLDANTVVNSFTSAQDMINKGYLII